MIEFNDNESKKLQKEKIRLILLYDKKGIPEKEYNEKIDVIHKRLAEIRKKILDEHNKTIETPEIQMAKKIIKSGIGRGRPVPVDGKAACIAKALQMKAVTNWEEMADKVMELMPDTKFDRYKLMEYGKFLMRKVRDQDRRRWIGYVWNKKTFELRKTQER